MGHLNDRRCISWCQTCEDERKRSKMREDYRINPSYVTPSDRYFVFAHPQDKGNNFSPSPTKLYDSVIAAECEAQRLARLEPKVRFCVGVIYKHYVNVPSPEICEELYGHENLR